MIRRWLQRRAKRRADKAKAEYRREVRDRVWALHIHEATNPSAMR
jgi:hypothetical protein